MGRTKPLRPRIRGYRERTVTAESIHTVPDPLRQYLPESLPAIGAVAGVVIDVGGLTSLQGRAVQLFHIPPVRIFIETTIVGPSFDSIDKESHRQCLYRSCQTRSGIETEWS
jgi:hypothetical protein